MPLSYFEGLALLYGVMSLVSLVCYGLDKAQAQRRGQRISERSLLTLAALGGAMGALLGMVLWHHKTAHARFRYLVPLCWLLQLALLILLYVRA